MSVVVPVYQEAGFIEALLGDLLRQRGPSFEVIVVDGGSSDGTVELVRGVAARDPRVRLLRNPRRFSSAGRALGVEAARGQWLAIVDGHCHVPTDTFLRDMVEVFERTGADCLARPCPLVARNPTYWTDAICAARASRFGHNLGSTLYDGQERPVDPRSSGSMYRRSVFEKVGNFDPAFDACEDVDLNSRVLAAGLRSWISPKLTVEYEPRRTLRALWRQMFRYGVGWAEVQRKRAGAVTLGPVIAGGFAAGLPVLCLAPILPGWLAAAVIAPYALYLALALASSLAAASPAPRLAPVLPLVYFVLHVGLGAGYLWGLTGAPAAARA